MRIVTSWDLWPSKNSHYYYDLLWCTKIKQKYKGHVINSYPNGRDSETPAQGTYKSCGSLYEHRPPKVQEAVSCSLYIRITWELTERILSPTAAAFSFITLQEPLATNASDVQDIKLTDYSSPWLEQEQGDGSASLEPLNQPGILCEYSMNERL